MDYDDVLELLQTRRSIRRFTDQKPTREQIEQLVEAACWAPSNHNRQGWKFLVFDQKQQIDDLAEQVRASVKKTLADAPRRAAEQSDEVLHFAGAFDCAPIVILAMHKRSLALGRTIVAAATSPLASGEVLSTAMAVENLLLAAHGMGLGACVMTAPLLAGDVWNALPDLPAGFEPTCLITLGYPVEQPEPPRRKDLKHVIEYR